MGAVSLDVREGQDYFPVGCGGRRCAEGRRRVREELRECRCRAVKRDRVAVVDVTTTSLNTTGQFNDVLRQRYALFA